MAVSYNLISCDDVLYPSIYHRYAPILNTYLGQIIGSDDFEGQYLVTRNNQCVFPYPYNLGALSNISVTIDTILLNGIEILTAPLTYTYSTSAYLKSNALGTVSSPTVYPTDYSFGQNEATVYVAGTTNPIAFSQHIQNAINASGIQNLYVYSGHRTLADIDNIDRAFFNFIVQKEEESTFHIEFSVTEIPLIGPTIVKNHIITFSDNTSTYTINGVSVVPDPGTVVNDYVTTEKAIFLYPLDGDIKTIDVFEECACELCDNCFTLTNCETGDTLTVKTDLVEEIGNVVVLEGYDGCWTVRLCDPIIEVVLTDSFVSCKSCLPNCNKPTC
jgi:hypothetical protein